MIQKLKLIRFNHSEDDTQGLLFWDKPESLLEFLCYTLEDEHRYEKIMHETRIPPGIYKLRLRTYAGTHEKYLKRYGKPWHQGMIEIMDVPGFTDILVHCGNNDDHTSGCILVGDSLRPGFLGSSRKAYEDFYPQVRDRILKGDEVILEIVNA